MDERTEQLINRRLDGEITQAESLELDKRLIREPEARAYLEEEQRIGALASRALANAIAPNGPNAIVPSAQSAWPSRTSRWQRVARGAVAVAAVIVLAVLVASIPPGKSRPANSGTLIADNTNNNTGLARQADPSVETVPVSDGIGSDLPRTGRHEVIGVYDDQTNSLYLLEMSPRTSSSTTLDF